MRRNTAQDGSFNPKPKAQAFPGTSRHSLSDAHACGLRLNDESVSASLLSPGSRRRCSRLRTRCSHNGFTLLEMLIAIVLVVTLMAGVWSLSSIYTRMFETGAERVAEAQLMRSLTQLIADDLLAVLPVVPADKRASRRARSSDEPAPDGSVAGAATGTVSFEFLTSSRLPHFGLVGGETALYVSVLQTAPVTVFPEELAEGVGSNASVTVSASDTAQSTGGREDGRMSSASRTVSGEEPVQRLAAFAPDLRIVAYTFQEPHQSGTSDPRPPAGLLRREVLWEFAERLTQSEDPTAARQASASEPSAETSHHVFDASTTLVPEVVGVQFRYFDGRSWNTTWDSVQRRALPVAVEVTLHLMTPEELATQSRLETGETDTTIELAASDSAVRSASPETLARVYRQLVYLPGATGQQERERSSSPPSSASFGQ